MELKAYFSNIHTVIIGHLSKAESDIVAAVAWFTDKDIFEVLCKKARAGITVSIALIGDQINQGSGGLNFAKLRNLGGKVIFLPPGSHNEPTMHHKFCVIDSSTVITGSYNWSHKARTNDENITVVTDAAKFASDYLDTFNNLLARTEHTPLVTIDTNAVRRRLEMIRNLILLGEQNDVAAQVGKLRPVAEALHLSRIITVLDHGEYRAALEEIESYLHKATALVTADSIDAPRLRFLLHALELRLESLSDEKAEIERSLIIFNRRYDSALSELIQHVLKARAELARLIANARKTESEREEAETSAEKAEETYQDYARQHESLQSAEPLPLLDEDAERELKSLYRKACSLCHPDKVPENIKEGAHHVFVELQTAYKASDLARVRKVLESLLAGGLPTTRSSTLTKAETLKAAIAEMEYAIVKQLSEIKALQESEAVGLMATAGSSEADWQSFFERQKESLDMELARLVSAIQIERTEQPLQS